MSEAEEALCGAKLEGSFPYRQCMGAVSPMHAELCEQLQCSEDSRARLEVGLQAPVSQQQPMRAYDDAHNVSTTSADRAETKPVVRPRTHTVRLS